MAISEGLVALKSIAKILKEAGKIDLYQQILDAQANMLEMQTELNNLNDKYKECKDKLDIKEDILFKNNAYW